MSRQLKFMLFGVMSAGLLLINRCNTIQPDAPVDLRTKTDVLKKISQIEKPFYDITLTFYKGTDAERKKIVYFKKNISRKELGRLIEKIVGRHSEVLISFGKGIPNKKQMEIMGIIDEIMRNKDYSRVDSIDNVIIK